MAAESNRFEDLVVYSSLSDVSHSAVSGVTPAYRARGDDGITEVHLRSNDPEGTFTYARSLVTSTSIAVFSALSLLGANEEADNFIRQAAQIESSIADLREELIAQRDS